MTTLSFKRIIRCGIMFLTVTWNSCSCIQNTIYPLCTDTKNCLPTKSDLDILPFEANFEAMKRKCDGHSHLIVWNCDGFACADSDSYHDTAISIIQMPDLKNICGVKGLYGTFESQSQKGANVATVFKLKDDLLETYTYCGCVREISVNNQKERQLIPDLYTITYNEQEKTFNIIPLSNSELPRIRVWDLSWDCRKTWYPFYGVDSPAPWHSEENQIGRPIYSLRSCDDAQIEVHSSSAEGHQMDIDDWHYSGNPFCFLAEKIDTSNAVSLGSCGDSQQCVDRCKSKNKGFDVALYSRCDCLCMRYEDLPQGINLHPMPCESEEGVKAEEKDSSRDECLYFTAFILRPEKDERIHYWNCIRALDYDRIEHPEQLMEAFYVKNAVACVKHCLDMNFELAILSGLKDTLNNVGSSGYTYPNSEQQMHCRCISYFKFQEQHLIDVLPTSKGDVKCVQTWCPGMQGPCVSTLTGSTSQLYSAVYCTQYPCGSHYLASIYDDDNICNENEQRVDPLKGCFSDVFYSCVKSSLTGRNIWKQQNCISGSVKPHLGICCTLIREISPDTTTKATSLTTTISTTSTTTVSTTSTTTTVSPTSKATTTTTLSPTSKATTTTLSPTTTTSEKNRSTSTSTEWIPTPDDGTNCIFTDQTVCNCFDSDDQHWISPLNTLAKKPCSEEFVGEKNWFCGPNNVFTTKQPDTSDCVENWIISVNNEVEDKKPALDISDYLRTQLIKNKISHGGLYNLTFVVDNLLDLRRDQLEDEEASPYNNVAFTSNLLTSLNAMLDQRQAWSLINPSNGYEAFLRIVHSENKAGAIYAEASERNQSIEYSFEGSIMYNLIKDVNNCCDVINVVKEGVASIEMPCQNLQHQRNNQDLNVFLATIYDLGSSETTNMFPQSEQIVRSLIDFSHLRNKTSLSIPIVLKFFHEPSYKAKRECVFYNENDLEWSKMGCEVDLSQSRADMTVCRCTHLTTFSLIFMPGPDTVTLQYLSLILGGTSCACVLLNIIINMTKKFQLPNNFRRTILMNRNVTYLLSMLLFIFAIDKSIMTRHSPVCVTLTFITHYLMIASFVWTALEGYLLYRALVVIFDIDNVKKRWYYLVGYGLPAVVAITTIVVAVVSEDLASNGRGGSSYSRNDICWLGDKYIYAFVVPLALMLIGNTGIMIAAIFISNKAAKNKQTTKRHRIGWNIRNCIVLTYLLGITWAVGFLKYVPEIGIWIDYLFVTLHSFTGMLILANTLLFRKQARDTIRKILSTTSTGLSEKRTSKSPPVFVASSRSSPISTSSQKSLITTRQWRKRTHPVKY